MRKTVQLYATHRVREHEILPIPRTLHYDSRRPTGTYGDNLQEGISIGLNLGCLLGLLCPFPYLLFGIVEKHVRQQTRAIEANWIGGKLQIVVLQFGAHI